MLIPPPDMYPGCTWADQPVTATTPFGIGTAATVEPRTGLTTRYKVTAYDPHARTVTVLADVKENRAGVVRPAPDRDRPRTIALDDVDELRLIHRRTRDDTTALHTDHCRHAIKMAFTAGGDRGVPGSRRVYRLWMETTEGRTYRFLVRAPSQAKACDVARAWWQGTRCPDGWTGGRLQDGDRIDVLTCEGARDMPVWPYPDPIADPV
ncbi:hypothetical protein [Streptomyces botrytidirepellens]|uniref:Uncharacterized protein n=1 Tax=Streptomyces botrytidirepellens TaxID=2486417 RepID=A0A3M8UG56_9ACTN|nr:hypothetical protein [Streptomyces botrytidirepellens]RNG04304.1 hypothetical protein EEJ42_34305 [Streptomyces botrytidirepellens]